MTPEEIARQLGARIVAGGDTPPDPVCAVCGGPRSPRRGGGPALCAPCSWAELGTTAYKLALAVEFHLSLKVIEDRLYRYGPPFVNPRAWITARTRLRH